MNKTILEDHFDGSISTQDTHLPLSQNFVKIPRCHIRNRNHSPSSRISARIGCVCVGAGAFRILLLTANEYLEYQSIVSIFFASGQKSVSHTPSPPYRHECYPLRSLAHCAISHTITVQISNVNFDVCVGEGAWIPSPKFFVGGGIPPSHP